MCMMLHDARTVGRDRCVCMCAMLHDIICLQTPRWGVSLGVRALPSIRRGKSFPPPGSWAGALTETTTNVYSTGVQPHIDVRWLSTLVITCCLAQTGTMDYGYLAHDPFALHISVHQLMHALYLSRQDGCFGSPTWLKVRVRIINAHATQK